MLQNITDLAAIRAIVAAAATRTRNDTSSELEVQRNGTASELEVRSNGTDTGRAQALVARRRRALGKPVPVLFPGAGDAQFWSARWSGSSAAPGTFQVPPSHDDYIGHKLYRP